MKTKDLILISFFTALTVICSYIKIILPFTPVPVTFQTLAVILSGIILGPVNGILSQILFLALIILFPVIPSGSSLAVLYGPTGGYISGFIFSAFISGYIYKRKKDDKHLIIAYIFGLLVIFASGVLWLALGHNMNFISALTVGLIPFIPGEIIKFLLAVAIIKRIEPLKIA